MKVTTDACLFGAIVADEITAQNKFLHALDIGAGTGLLSLMMAQTSPSLKIKALELDLEAAGQASENIFISPWRDRIELLNGDLLHYKPGLLFDLIISNPPFYENEMSSPDEKINMARHNPDLPLTKLFSHIRELLNEQGEFWVLLPYKRNNEIRQLLHENEFFAKKIIMVRNSAKHDYFRIILNIKKQTVQLPETVLEEFSIYDSNGDYTSAFASLLAPYYLRL